MYSMICGVAENSIGAKKGIRLGDELVSINGEPVLDYIDYAYFMGEENLLLNVRSQDGEQREVKIRKKDWQDIGLSFADEQVGSPSRCRNKCIFCFVDQLPSGMRKTLHVKDDDWRHSFLMGNYVTFTNLTEEDVSRMIRRKVSPLYVSVHATDEELRKKLLGNPYAPPILPLLKTLTAAGIHLHTQIVLCEGVNDGEYLKETIADLFSLYPGVESVAVVPVGLTGHREKLPGLKPVSQENAKNILEAVHALQTDYLARAGTRFVFAADENYIRAGAALPEFEAYEDFSQIENGVGLIALFLDGVQEGMQDYAQSKYAEVSVATGEDFAPVMKEIAKKLNFAYNMHINVCAVRNSFFGETITVAGLLTGRDVVTQLAGKPLGERLFLPGSMFREFTDVTLDGMTVREISDALQVPVQVVPPDGYEWIRVLTKE
jgi:putative radical SAM enzyme (TIGR03279 family)